VVEDVPPNTTVVGNPGHTVKVEGRRVEGPDTDWIHLPDPIAEAIRALSERIAAVENRLADLTGEQRPEAKVRELGQRKGRSSAGG
jgi:serine O-acetyltransferase